MLPVIDGTQATDVKIVLNGKPFVLLLQRETTIGVKSSCVTVNLVPIKELSVTTSFQFLKAEPMPSITSECYALGITPASPPVRVQPLART